MRAARLKITIMFVLLGAVAPSFLAAAGVTPLAARADGDGSLHAPPLPRPATGYWFAGGDGGLFSFGAAEFRGSMGGTRLVAPVVGMAATPSGGGYWMAARDGGVFSFGDAAFHGSMGGQHLNKPIVAMAATPTGAGYWFVGSDGGVFSFGDATFAGSTGNLALNKPIVAIAATPSGDGYWLAASDGGVFAFGDATFRGSMGSVALNAPIVAMVATPSGNGYWLVASDGGIFTFGDAAFFGSTGAMRLNKPIVAMAHSGFGDGYWLVASDGGVFSFGDATFFGSTGSLALSSPIVAFATRPRPGPIESAAFYYPWYGTETVDGRWRHWDDADPQAASPSYAPPDLIAASFYPAHGGPYSSRDGVILDHQFAEMAHAGIRSAVISWWGRGSFEDARLGPVIEAARRHGVEPAIHLEPYEDRTPESVAQDVSYLTSAHGIDDVWIYVSDGPQPSAWRTVTDSFPHVTFWGHSHRASNATSSLFASYAANAGFDGVYTYDALPYSPESFARVCDQARARDLRCSPSVNPGYDDLRIRPATGAQRGRESGARYDAYWRGAFRAGPDVVSITSFNEWHEGTQIEAAEQKCIDSVGCYETYEGAYGARAEAATHAYLDRTRAWTTALTAASR